MTAMSAEDFVALINTAKDSKDWRPVFEIIPYFTFLGLRLEETDGKFISVLSEDRKFIGNPTLPALHGGVVGAFLESAALVHLLATQEVTQLPKIINITVEYLRSGKPIETYAEAVITKPGRRVANLRIEAWQKDRNKPIAAAHANFLVS
ncbi:PaaI family thioesterase [Sneathiella sp. CAU 1612]|uniref:PaaI family thioesterase n=1 Tax=Sneathiella sedimenti TaxID=2816034 RepID=A0ABS3F4U8_9PROT|nr:PaaI family thioesterase [Sneathiella sedimenti]MBO0333554.1 PaaI family thioesterase [Sneathiella sedimenti]